MSKTSVYSGKIKELFRFSIPLIITSLSTTVMMFIDRLLLARYSLDAFTAAVNAGIIAWGFAYGFQIFAEMSQVVVAQYQGANQSDKTAHPIWQMLWVVLASTVFFSLLSLWGGQLFFPLGSLQEVYFRYIIAFGPAFGLIGAGSAYFIGRGENRIVTISAIIGNLVNLLLDWVLIFGIEGWVPSMGIKGAAIATGIGMTLQGLILLSFFLMRTKFKIKFLCWKELKRCLRVGVPPGLFVGFELVGWGLFYSMMARASSLHILVTSICQSLLPILACVSIGLQKGVASIAGNMIGANNIKSISRLMQSGFVILSCFILFLFSLFYIFPEPVIKLFVGCKGGVSGLIDVQFYKTLKVGLLLSCGYLFFGGLRSIISGLLSAAGDSWFLTLAGALSVWILLLLPTYLGVLVGHGSVTVAQGILMAYGMSATFLYWLRFRQGTWADKALLIGEK